MSIYLKLNHQTPKMENKTESCDEVQPLKLKQILKEHNIDFKEEEQENATIITIQPKSAGGNDTKSE